MWRRADAEEGELDKETKKTTKKPACPLCGKPCEPNFLPFCSKRCKLRDLAHWLGGDEPYVIPGEPYSGLLDENGEPLVDLEDVGGDNVVFADFGCKQGRDDD